MTMTIGFGIFWILSAIGQWLGCPYLVPKWVRESEQCRAYQKQLAMADTLLGGSNLLVGFLLPYVNRKNFLWYTAAILIPGLTAILLTKNAKNQVHS